MIARLYLKDFKSHRDTTIEFGQLTVLVGPNGCGKTSVLEALHAASRLPKNKFSYIFKDQLAPEHVCRVSCSAFCISLRGRGTEPSWTMQLDAWREEAPDQQREGPAPWEASVSATVGDKTYEPRDANATHPAQGDWGTPYEVTTAISSAVLLRLDARRLAEASISHHAVPRIEHDGYGLATVLADLRLSDDQRFDRIISDLKRVVPAVRKVRFNRKQVTSPVRYRERVRDEWRVVTDNVSQVGQQLLLDLVGAPGIPAHCASDGTLLALGLATILHSPTRPSLILLDDIEQALHPRAQQELMAVIKDLLATQKDLQIVATTHSPYLVDAVAAKDVTVLAIGPDGTTVSRRLSDQPDARRALDVLTTGELPVFEG